MNIIRVFVVIVAFFVVLPVYAGDITFEITDINGKDEGYYWEIYQRFEGQKFDYENPALKIRFNPRNESGKYKITKTINVPDVDKIPLNVFFVVRSFDGKGNKSNFSNQVKKEIRDLQKEQITIFSVIQTNSKNI